MEYQIAFEYFLILCFYMIAIIVGLFALVVLVKIFTDSIDIKFLISEKDGRASLSRFQFLIFTFVISLSYFIEVVHQIQNGPTSFQLPDIPVGVLGLMGISGGSYVASKSIQKNAEAKKPKKTEESGWN